MTMSDGILASARKGDFYEVFYALTGPLVRKAPSQKFHDASEIR